MRKVIFTLLFIIIGSHCALSQTSFAVLVSGNNNNWNGYWNFSPAAGIILSHRFASLSIDGTFGYYHPSPSSTVLQSRFSVIPSFNLTFLNYFYLRPGLGVAHVYRYETEKDNSSSDNRERNRFFTETRIFGGVKLPISARTKLMLEGGFSYITKNNNYFQAGAGISFSISPPFGKRVMVNTAQSILSNNEISSAPRDSLIESLKSISIVQTSDPVLQELNIFLEEIFLDNNLKIIDWNTLRIETANSSQGKITNSEIVATGVAQKNLDAYVETSIRYSFKKFGEETLVHNASVRIINARTGAVIWVINYDSNGLPFSNCKSFLLDELNKSWIFLIPRR